MAQKKPSINKKCSSYYHRKPVNVVFLLFSLQMSKEKLRIVEYISLGHTGKPRTQTQACLAPEPLPTPLSQGLHEGHGLMCKPPLSSLRPFT